MARITSEINMACAEIYDQVANKYAVIAAGHIATGIGFISYAYPPAKIASVGLGLMVAEAKLNNGYFSNQDAAGDAVGALVGYGDTMTGMVADIAIDSYELTDKKVDGKYKIHGGSFSDSKSKNNQQNQKIGFIPAHQSSNSVQKSLLGIDDSKSPQEMWDSIQKTNKDDKTNTN